MILREVIRKKRSSRTDYPFNLPLIQQFESLTFSSPVTILAGDNGSGKTTMLKVLLGKQQIDFGKIERANFGAKNHVIAQGRDVGSKEKRAKD